MCTHAQVFEVQEEKSDVSDNKVRIFFLFYVILFYECVFELGKRNREIMLVDRVADSRSHITFKGCVFLPRCQMPRENFSVRLLKTETMS